MNKRSWLLWASTLILLGSLEASPSPTQTTLVLVADEWAPYNMLPGQKEEGYIVDIVREIFTKRGFRIDYRIVPWARAIQDTRQGFYDGVIGASVRDAPGFIFPSEPVAVNRLAFVTTLASRWTYQNHESINQVSLGVIRGYDYRTWLSSYIEKNQSNPARVQEAFGESPLVTNFRKLMANKLEALVDSETALLYTATKLGLQDQIRVAGRDAEPAYIHIAFTPSKVVQAESWARILSDGIRELRKSGRLKVILARYGLSDWY